MSYRSKGKAAGIVGILTIPTLIGALLLKWQGELLTLKDKFGTVPVLLICCMLGLAVLIIVGIMGIFIFGGKHD